MERIRASLFLAPMAGVLIGIADAAVTLWIDGRLDLQGGDLPLGVTSTVASARAALSTVAGAAITFAAIAFSISLLIIQQASSQFSPRVVQTFFGTNRHLEAPTPTTIGPRPGLTHSTDAARKETSQDGQRVLVTKEPLDSLSTDRRSERSHRHCGGAHHRFTRLLGERFKAAAARVPHATAHEARE
jgi:hypothetical protein